MELFFAIIIIILLTGFGLVFWQVKKNRPQEKDDKSVLMLQNQINEITRTLDNRLGDLPRIMQSQFGQSAQIISSVTEKLTKLDETNRQVMGFAQQLQSLENILKNPKQRGILGEYYLETLLKNAFQPNQYQMQYKLGKDENTGADLIVDAVLFFGDKMIPIDSKFSLENYNRIVEEHDFEKKSDLEKVFKSDLKKRIDETAKYVRPDLGTMELAFMFIPAEGIYYDLLINKVGAVKVNTRDLIDYAIHEKKVHIVSPTTFYVTLQSLLQGMRAYQIQESTKEILKNVGMLGKHLKSYEDYLKKLGNNLGTTVNMYNSAYKEFAKIDKDVTKLIGGEKQVDPLEIEKPRI
ncbi:DNA recombination protein RmuC [Candidatus Parcubacteria bacterium]|nr:MAG: DNA recombination protein RmuC [Candidatus Parcubacteria bacterium]